MRTRRNLPIFPFRPLGRSWPIFSFPIPRSTRSSTVDLARDLEAEGYTTWWDTGLLPDDVFFPESDPRRDRGGESRDRDLGRAFDRLALGLLRRRPRVTSKASSCKFATNRSTRAACPCPSSPAISRPSVDRAKIFAALARRGIVPSKASPEPPIFRAAGHSRREKIGAPIFANLFALWQDDPGAVTSWLKALCESAVTRSGESFRDIRHRAGHGLSRRASSLWGQEVKESH